MLLDEVLDPARRRLGLRRIATRVALGKVAPIASLLATVNVAVAWHASYAARLYAAAFLLVVPGCVVVSLVPARPREASVRIAWAVGASVGVLMTVGLLWSTLLPHLGIARPLRSGPLLVGVDLVVLGGLVAHGGRVDPLDYLFQGHLPRLHELRLVALAALLPLGAIAGAERLNNGRGGLVLGVVVVLAVLAGILVPLAKRLAPWKICVALYAMTAAVLLLSSMRSAYPYGYDIQSEFQVFTSTLQHGIWHVPKDGNAYASMLSITVLPTTLTQLTGISPALVFKACYPLVFALFPVLVFVSVRRWFPDRAALVGALVVVVQGIYAADITGLARQEIGLVFFALFVVTAFDPALERRWRQLLALVAFTGMAVSHYSTAYFAVLVIVGGYLVGAVLRRFGKDRSFTGTVTLPFVVAALGVTMLWNVGITRSARNLANVVSSLASSGLALLPGPPGASFLQRFLNADVTPTVSARPFAAMAAAHYRLHAPFIHPYPAALTARYPVRSASAPATVRAIPHAVPAAVATAATICAELFLLATAIGVLALLWQERRGRTERAELAWFSLACLVLLGVLRLSGTASSLYNAPRGQVQAAPLLGLGLALSLAWWFERTSALYARHLSLFAHRGRITAGVVGATALSCSLLFVTGSGLAELLLGGGGPDLLTNYGEAYQRYYITDADMAAAGYVVHHQRPGQLIYADVYAGLQIFEDAHPRGLVTTVIPQVLEPGAFVLASSTNVVDHTARSLVDGTFGVYRFPSRFLRDVKDVVFTTGTAKVYR